MQDKKDRNNAPVLSLKIRTNYCTYQRDAGTSPLSPKVVTIGLPVLDRLTQNCDCAGAVFHR